MTHDVWTWFRRFLAMRYLYTTQTLTRNRASKPPEAPPGSVGTLLRDVNGKPAWRSSLSCQHFQHSTPTPFAKIEVATSRFAARWSTQGESLRIVEPVVSTNDLFRG